MTKPRIVLVDDHDILRAGAAKYLSAEFDVVGEAGDVQEAIEVIVSTDPDGVLLDVHLPSGSGAAVVRAVRAANIECRFVCLSVSADRRDVIKMLQAGVDGYLVKSTLGNRLPELVSEALDGSMPVSPQIAGFLLDIDDVVAQEPAVEQLSPREREVAEFIARGYSYRKTADALFVSVKTVETHMSHIFEKLGVASRHELAARAFESGFVSPEGH
ncbi:MAG: response regulator [Acidimicrobiia bacterium]|jgi:DNA-binding NarL/FixJ family response regulator